MAHAAPSSRALLEQAAHRYRGQSLARIVSSLLALLGDYGAAELEFAIAEALQQQVQHPTAVRQVLERRRETRDQPPPIAITLTGNAKANNIVVRPASLALYDQINAVDTTDDGESDALRTVKETT